MSATWFDHAIATVAPRMAARRVMARQAFETLTRGYDGAARGRRTEGWRAPGSSADTEIGVAGALLRDRMRDLVRNNPHAAKAVAVLVNNIIGAGIMPRAASGDDKLDRKVDALFERWTAECDADGQLDFYGLQTLICREMVEAGEVLVRRRLRRASDGLPVPLQLQVLEADFLDATKSGALGAGRLVQGIEFDPVGKRRAYWLHAEHPGDAYGALQNGLQSRPVPASEIAHVYEKQRTQAEALRATMAGVAEAATAPLESIASLREAVTGSGLDAEAALNGARTAADGLGESLDATGEAAGRAGGAGRGAGQALREAADTARGAWEATAEAVRAAQERSREIAQGLAQDIVGPIKEALQSGEFTWETFASAISRIAQNLANRLIELAFKPIENALMRAFSGMGGGGGFFASLFGFARGGAFAGGHELTAFARGGVVNHPTVFPFSRGIGLMGEAGPEAILPLRRGRDGRLGVEMNSAPTQPAQDMSTRIINVLDPSVVGDYLATPSGERVILNVIRRNRSALNA